MVMIEVDKDAQIRTLDALAKSSDGFQFFRRGFVPYTSGLIGNYFTQCGGIMENGEAYRQAVSDMVGLANRLIAVTGVSKDNLIIAGGETRDWMFSGPVARELGLPHTMIYKDGKTVGAKMKGKNILYVSDLNNEGSSYDRNWVPTTKKEGGIPTAAGFLVDRLEKGIKVLDGLGLTHGAVVPLNIDAWTYLQDKKVVTPEIYEQLCKRTKDMDKWAREMLVSDEGLDCLAALVMSGKTLEKANKVFDQGYPDMKSQLIKLLQNKFGSGVCGRVSANGFL